MAFPKTTLLLLLLSFLFTACDPEDATDLTNQEVNLRGAFSDVLPLPNGFAPEGIVAGDGNTYYVGSLADGSIYRGDFKTGAGEVFYTPPSGGVAVGLAYDQATKYLYVSGGPTGGAYVLDTRSGREVARFDFEGGFVNDAIVTKDAVYFTESFTSPRLYVVELGNNGKPNGTTRFLVLSGDFQFEAGSFNANGIEATADGKDLIVVNSTFGTLYRVDPVAGQADEIDLGGASVENGDGLLLSGNTLYVVQNRNNQIAEIALDPDLLSGRITDIITDSDFRVPTTVTRKGSTLYTVNARFGTPPGPDVDYEVVAVRR